MQLEAIYHNLLCWDLRGIQNLIIIFEAQVRIFILFGCLNFYWFLLLLEIRENNLHNWTIFCGIKFWIFTNTDKHKDEKNFSTHTKMCLATSLTFTLLALVTTCILTYLYDFGIPRTHLFILLCEILKITKLINIKNLNFYRIIYILLLFGSPSLCI